MPRACKKSLFGNLIFRFFVLQEGDKESRRQEVLFRSLDSVKRRMNGEYPFVSIRSVYQLGGGEIEKEVPKG